MRDLLSAPPVAPPIKVALAGNPNSGKTSIFNALTRGRQRVGNYPGVTVERKQGRCQWRDHWISIVDLPGTYSLTAYSIEEIVARNFLIDEAPDVVVVVVDATNLERNLYLVVQLAELGVPLVVALNLSDLAAERGLTFDLDALSDRLGAPVIPTVGHRGQGIGSLLDAVVATSKRTNGNGQPAMRIDYGAETEAELGVLDSWLATRSNLNGRSRWVALKLLEGDRHVAERVAIDPSELAAVVRKHADRLQRSLGDTPELVIAQRRYARVGDLCDGAVGAPEHPERTASDRIDAVLLHRWLGIPIFLALMYSVFQLTFTLGAQPMQWIEGLFGWLAGAVTALWPAGSAGLLRSLIVDGVLAGVGGVLVFLPNILLLFFAIAILEDSGYMARAAFLMDRIMAKIGLHGRSFIPMLLGFGCSVPAIMATRTLQTERDRLTTMLVTPLMSCGARLPIYALLIPAFFPAHLRGPMLWTMYVIGILLAIAAAKFLRARVFTGPATPFVMELPPYRLPTARSMLLQMWQRAAVYLRKAGGIILAMSVILWALSTFPRKADLDAGADLPAATGAVAVQTAAPASSSGSADEDAGLETERLAYSIAGRIGHAMEPVLRPMGFDWKIGTALIGALAAKEVFVAQLGIVYSVGAADQGSEALRTRLATDYTQLQAFCIMLFCLIGIPCMATVAITRRESNSWTWAIVQLIGLTSLAAVLTTIAYQVGSRLGLGT